MSEYEVKLIEAGFKVERIGTGAASAEVLTRPVSPEVVEFMRAMAAKQESSSEPTK